MGSDPRPARTAVVVHGALLATVVMWSAGYQVLAALAPPAPPPLGGGLGNVLPVVFLAMAGGVTLLGVLARARLQAPRLVEDADVFWRENRGPIYAAWIAAEAGAMAGVVLAWLTGMTFAAVGLPAVGIVTLLLSSPRALRRR